MKRGFLTTTKYKRAIEEAYSSTSPLRGPHKARPKQSASADDQDVEMNGVEDDAHAHGGVALEDEDEDDWEEEDADGGDVPDTVGDDEMGAAPQPNGQAKKKKKKKKTKGKGKQKAVDMDVDEPIGDDATTPNKSNDKGKGKAKVVEDVNGDDESLLPPRPYPPERQGWGRRPEEDFFHTVPRSHGGPHRKRAVFRAWPRDPNGKPLLPNTEHQGTLSPDGYRWGETFYDFFHVQRLPTVPGMMSVMTGSALRQAMEALGEVETASASELLWALSEREPRNEGAADTEELIHCKDRRARSMCGSPFGDLMKDDEQDGNQNKKQKRKQKRDSQDDLYDDSKLPTFIPPPPTIPVSSPFHPSHYPAPYVLTPFENSYPILLQERIPFHLLPKKLYVHDPFYLLPAVERRFRDTSWRSRPDIVRTYNLQLSKSVRSQVKEVRKKAEEMEEFKARTLVLMRFKRTKEEIENYRPEIEVPLPPYQRRPTRCDESHLYLSPVAKVGQGHHSLVYKGEWELPREMFMKEKICRVCFEESANKEIQRLKDTGRWAKLLKAAAWGPKGFTGRKPTQADLDAVNDPVDLQKDGEIIERELICVVPPGMPPSQLVDILGEKNIWEVFMQKKGNSQMEVHFTAESDESKSDAGSYVARFRIDPPFTRTFEIQQKSCPHRRTRGPVPRTAKFTVVAKLSIEHDNHLRREARNYQDFPEHFFHHYNGYSIVPQLRTIVPVYAVVPQFYGYYTPDTSTGTAPGHPTYLSPVMLLEHCGEPIVPEQLTVEEQEECTSLLLRFQRAWWLHESVAPRNFLVQYGKPTEFPLTRMCKPEPSFRLIDFGRSRKYTTAAEKRAEETEALKMFEGLHGQMAVTLR